jgi:hypothetical protein
MNIYNEQGDMTSERVSEASGKVAKSVSTLVTSLLADGVSIVEVRAMLLHIETEVTYAATLCLMEHRMKDMGGWPVPVEVHHLYPACLSEDCPHHKECANHTSAGDIRSCDGDTPTLVKEGTEWLCTKCPESHGRGAILIDDTSMEK